MIFDAHAHYDDDAYDADRDVLLSRLHGEGVGYILNSGSDIASSEASVSLAHRWDFVWAAVGVHPHEAKSWNDEAEMRLRELLEDPRVVALGEIGLDYHYDLSPREVQKAVFRRQLEIARERDIPVVIHEREALGDTLEMIGDFPGIRGMFHCFSGSPETAAELVKKGWYISLGGAVTFKNAKKPPAVLASVPEDRLLVETDCPYMAPVPHRGKRNHSGRISFVLEKAEEVRGVPANIIEQQTCENALRLFGIKERERKDV
ncbi:MAG: TatD family hydrolase [Clostridia bacterium]|nr:TatD family hydrolase [Clostridia bacterium]